MLASEISLFSKQLVLGFYLIEEKGLATLTGRAPELCGWALCPGLVLLLSSLAGLSVQALSSSCPLWLGSGLCIQALSSSCPLWLGSCPPLVLVLAAPLNSVAGLCVRVLSSSCPCFDRAPELCGWSLRPGLLERSVAEQIAMSMPTKIH